MRQLATLPLLFSLLAASGCTTFDAPTADITGVTVTEMTAEAMKLTFDLVLENPNEEPLELYELHYTLHVDGETVYEGRRSAQATLAAKSSRTLSVPAIARFDAAPSIAGASFQFGLKGHLGYLTPDRLSRVMRDLHLSRPKVRFNAEGLVEPPSDP